MQEQYDLALLLHNFEVDHLQRWSKAFLLSSSFTNLTKGLAARWLFRVIPWCESTVHLQNIHASGVEPRPYDTLVDVTILDGRLLLFSILK
ncbi:hypothetical protein TNCV_729601 [Trichonephila clavipes]|nr:hypothetical protein TNCV_729601 [Trichonephila clavipes]